MYSDLELRYNSHAPNEPEFRAYMVLMKLNEGDILRYIQFIIAFRSYPAITSQLARPERARVPGLHGAFEA